MLELRHLNTLTALRAHGSLAAAADELHVTASAVSHQLKELENYYDISLVNRRGTLDFNEEDRKPYLKIWDQRSSKLKQIVAYAVKSGTQQS